MAHVLVVDDDSDIRAMLVQLLEQAGHQVDSCGDGAEALESLRAHKHELVLLDMMIPRINGFAVIEELRNDFGLHDTPVIMMSGIYGSRAHRSDMLHNYEVYEYLDKPLNFDQVVALVHEVEHTGREEGGLEPLAEQTPPDPITLVAARSQLQSSHAERVLIDEGAQRERQAVEAEARTFAQETAPKGSLADTDVARLLAGFYLGRQTGGLLLTNGKRKKVLYLRDGVPCGVRSNLVHECLGQLLVRERMISRDACLESIRRMRESKERQGAALIAMGALTEEKLRLALTMQKENKLFEAFSWTVGTYQWNPKAALPEGGELGWPAPLAIAEGIRQSYSDSRLEQLLPMEQPLRPRGALPLDSLGLPPSIQGILRTTSWPQTPRTLSRPKTAFMLAALYGMVVLEHLTPKPD